MQALQIMKNKWTQASQAQHTFSDWTYDMSYVNGNSKDLLMTEIS